MSSIYIIALATPDGALQYEDLYTQVVSLRSHCVYQSLIINMKAVRFVYADALLALTSVVRLWYQWSGRKVFFRDLDYKVHRYLERMDFFEKCADWLEQHRVLESNKRLDRKEYSERLLEVTPIPSDEEKNAVIVPISVDRIRKILNSTANRHTTNINELCTMLAEITHNVIHSSDQGFAVVQRYRTSGIIQSYRVMIGVVDLGIGIEDSLQRSEVSLLKPGDQNRLILGSDYIMKALDFGVSSRNSGGGLGLWQVRRIVENWRGTLTIRSQKSRVHITANTVMCVDNLAEIPGTQVTISVQGS
ncbi:MAG: hypothetical protein OHK0022_08790 [Roseiflexaceae bacterium]